MTIRSWCGPFRFSFSTFLFLFAAVTFLVTSRKFFLGDAESDYLGTYLVEAERFLSGQPLFLKFHPPLYSILIAVVNSLLFNWFATGLVVSWVSSLTALAVIFIFFRRLAGEWAALGSALGLVSAPSFIVYAVTASSDIFFLALYCACLLFALLADMKGSKLFWFLTGFFIALTFLTRTNALSLSPLFFLPWLGGQKGDSKSCFLFLLAGFLIPMLVWVGYAHLSGSPFWVQEAHVNLAMTYFAPTHDRMTYDSYFVLRDQFANSWDVIRHDPLRIMSVYTVDFVFMIGRNFLLLVFPVLSVTALVGFKAFLKTSQKPFVYVYLIATALHIMLMNFKAYESRFYLFLIPLVGASAGSFLEQIFEMKFLRRKSSALPKLVFLFSFFLGISFSSAIAYTELHSIFEDELEEAVPEARNMIAPGSIVVARKPNVPFYAGSALSYFPNVETFDELKKELTQLPKGKNVFLYYGSYERKMRPQFSALGGGEGPSFLVPITRSKTGRDWVLYRVNL